ncbi:hypothetical protein V6Z11_A01G143100 [Gossypium hirsutum]
MLLVVVPSPFIGSSLKSLKNICIAEVQIQDMQARTKIKFQNNKKRREKNKGVRISPENPTETTLKPCLSLSYCCFQLLP